MTCNAYSSSASAAFIELAAIGQADTLLTCDPKMSYFTQTYARTTNFAMGEQTIAFDTQPPTGQNWRGATLTAEISRKNFDLLGPVYFDACLSGLPGQITVGPTVYTRLWTPAVGFALIKESTVDIGNTHFETLHSEYMVAHDEISRPEGLRASKLVGDYGGAYLRSGFIADAVGAIVSDCDTLAKGMEYSTRTQKILTPLPHFWTKHVGNYLNIVGLSHQNVKLRLTTRSFDELQLQLGSDTTNGSIEVNTVDQRAFASDQGKLLGATLLATYIVLSTEERRLKAQCTQTIRYVYVQKSSKTYKTKSTDAGNPVRLTNMFKNPITRMLWMWRSSEALANNEYFRFGGYRAVPVQLTGSIYAPQEVLSVFSQIEVKVNQNTRVCEPSEYFLYAQPYAHAERVPDRIVESYSFALHPDDDSCYSGSINLSRVENFEIDLLVKDRVVTGGAVAAADYLSEANKIGGKSPSLTAADTVASDLTGEILLYAETINFYKQSAGMIGQLFPQ